MRLLEDITGYEFKNIELLHLALTHSSCSKTDKAGHELNNERLEFLGDAVLKLVVSQYLFFKYPDYDEGKLTKITAALVSGKALYEVGDKMGLKKHLRHSKSLNGTFKRSNLKLISGCVEAIIGAIYVDGTFDDASKFVLKLIEMRIDDIEPEDIVDSKSRFQEIIQAGTLEKISYNVIEMTGPQHDPLFKVELCVGNRVYSTGTGKSKREAEQHAASKAISNIEKKR